MISHLGLVKTTLVDVPGRVAATLFTHGCPLTCPYCHNAHLQSGPIPEDFLPRHEVTAFLRKRAAVLQAVCLTGGEPLVHADVPELLREVRALGYVVKLDTSGAFPERLKHLLDEGLVDMVAMDIKAAPEHYDRVGGSGSAVVASLELLRHAVGNGAYTPTDAEGPADAAPSSRTIPAFSYELRTTLAPSVVNEEELSALARVVKPHERWVWAQFRPPEAAVNPRPQPVPYPVSTVRAWYDRHRATHPLLALRGV